MRAGYGPRAGTLGAMISPSPEIVCVDCGGRCFLLTPAPEDGIWEAGDVVAYRCEDCLDRWDLELTDADDADGGDGA
jgi:hypothetical protein